MQDLDFLNDFINAPSPVMYETDAQLVWGNYIKPYVSEIKSDNYGNVYGIRYSNNQNPNKIKVLLDAHVDEISYIVNSIGEDGLIHPIRNGGSDIQLALSKEVKILTKTGEVDGVFGWIPIHNKSDEKVKDIKPERGNIFIDIGATSKEEVINMGVNIGDPIIYAVNVKFLNSTNNIYGKSLDDKIGGYINAMVLKTLHEKNIDLPFDLYVLNSVQEEVGAFGAKIAIGNIKPDVAIVFDVFFDSTNPLFPDKKMLGTDAKLNDGVIIMNSACVQKKLYELLINTAIGSGIKYKTEHSTGYGGTNADRIFLEGGIATALLSIPLKYMHTTVEMVSMDDVESSIKLICDALKNINGDHDFRPIKF